MMKRKNTRALLFSLSFWLILTLAPSAFGQSSELRIDYTVRVASLDEQLFHVTADVKNIKQSELFLSLPTWTPGWYTVENYAKNILRFQVTDAKGARLPHSMTRKQTWRVDTKGLERIKVEFDYYANTLALNQAKITRDFAFFTGIELFLMAEGHRENPSAVRFEIPSGWKIVSALKATSDPMTFKAGDYDTLVDAPTEMGNFDLTSFEVQGKPHFFVSTPAGAFSKDKADRMAQILTRIAQTESAIFGDLPYEKYVYFYFFARAESNASGALEHLNSYVAFAPGATAAPEDLAGTAAHEFFHLWNVKRVRPIEMWPYDYSRENETPLLWVSEGFTNYYAALTLYRAGLRDRQGFLSSVAGAIGGVENNEARNYISPADASTSTWLGYDTPVAFGISYYTQGQNLGALLDLSIRHDTAGAASLDDVMRALYQNFYLKGKGFSTEDMIEIINRLTKRDYHDFYRRYVQGVEAPPYDTILGYAGYRLEKSSQKTPVVGLSINNSPDGLRINRINAGGPADRAGLEQGDVVLAIDELDARRDARAVVNRLSERIGRSVKMRIKRGDETREVELKVEGHEEAVYQIVEVAKPAPEQLKVREGWLKASKMN